MKNTKKTKMIALGTIIPMLLIAAALAIGGTATETNAAVGYAYLDENGDSVDTGTTAVKELWGATDFGGGFPNFFLSSAGSSGWYIVMDDIYLGTGSTIGILGTVNLIIGAGCTLTTDLGIVSYGGPLNIWAEDPDDSATGGIGIGKLRSLYGYGLNIEYISLINTAHIIAEYTAFYADSSVTVTNGITGVIEGQGIGMSIQKAGGTINNKGKIIGGTHGLYITGTSGPATINNEGSIEGDLNGIFVECHNVTINNEGSIISNSTGYGISSTSTNTVVNNNAGASIIGKRSGILLSNINANGKIDNKGLIEGSTYGTENNSGILVSASSAEILNGTAGTITGPVGVYLANFRGDLHQIVNDGKIEGVSTYGLAINNGNCNTNAITNNGKIIGSTSAVFIPEGTNMRVINSGSITSAWSTGVYFGSAAPDSTLTNNAGDGANTGYISGDSIAYGVSFASAGTLHNYGKIAGGVNGGNNLVFTNYAGDSANTGIVEGNVALGNSMNTVEFHPGSKITGNFTMGTNGSSTLSFKGTPIGTPLTYATVGGNANIGLAWVSFSGLDGLLTPYESGTIVLIDAGTGSVSGPISTYSTVSPDPVIDFLIISQSKALIAVPLKSNVPYTDEDGDPQTHDAIEIDQAFFGSIGVSGSLPQYPGATGTDGTWYYVANDISLSGLSITGDVSIIIKDGCTLSLTGASSDPSHSLNVYSGKTLGIYSQPGANSGVVTSVTDCINLGYEGNLINTATIYASSLSGVYSVGGGTIINGVTGTIESSYVGVFLSSYAMVINKGNSTNTGLIKGDVSAVYIGTIIRDSGAGDSIINNGKIEATGSGGSGICINYGTGIQITNGENGIITSPQFGIVITEGDPARVFNYGLISGTSLSGISLSGGGEVYNYNGEISGGINGIYTEGSLYLEQYADIIGNVILTDETNYVLFASGSYIDGDFSIGSDPDSFIKFIGELSIDSFTYAIITGSTDIGNKTAEVYIFVAEAMLPESFAIGDKIILIEGGPEGTVITAPLNDTYSEDGKHFKIYVAGNQLIAEMYSPVAPVKDYYIKASADAKTSISPAGTTVVQKGTSITFTFSAAAGSFVGAVIVDGLYLSQTDIDKGSYTFTNVMANHSIQVIGRDPMVGILLIVNVIEGNGYAEYSVNGGSFARYSSAVPIAEGADVTLRAIANGGFEFVKWMNGTDVLPLTPVTFMDNRANLEVSLYFSVNDSSSDSPPPYLLIILLVIIVVAAVAVVAFLLKKGKG